VLVLVLVLVLVVVLVVVLVLVLVLVVVFDLVRSRFWVVLFKKSKRIFIDTRAAWIWSTFWVLRKLPRDAVEATSRPKGMNALKLMSNKALLLRK